MVKRILPTEERDKELYSSMQGSIKSDKTLAFCLQTLEAFLESIASYSLLLGVLVHINLWNTATLVVTVVLSILVAFALQYAFHSNTIVIAIIEENKAVAAKIGGYGGYILSAFAIVVIAFVLNVSGGYVFGTSYTYKATKQTDNVQNTRYEAEVAAAEKEYQDAATMVATTYDIQIQNVNDKWSAQLKAAPNAGAWVATKKDAALRPLLVAKQNALNNALNNRKERVEKAKGLLNSQTAYIQANNEIEASKQTRQEGYLWWATVVASFFLIVLSGFLHRRATKVELKCGVTYELMVSEKEEQNALSAWAFALSSTVNKVLRHWAVGFYHFFDGKFNLKFRFGTGNSGSDDFGIETGSQTATAATVQQTATPEIVENAVKQPKQPQTAAQCDPETLLIPYTMASGFEKMETVSEWQNRLRVYYKRIESSQSDDAKANNEAAFNRFVEHLELHGAKVVVEQDKKDGKTKPFVSEN